MFERIVEAIGRFLSKLFGFTGDFIDNVKVSSSIYKDQIKTTTNNTKATLSISVSGEGHVNYFRNRVVGEFLKVIVSLLEYKYDKESGKYVAYLVRHKKKSLMEYLRFSKDSKEDIDADITYTVINKLLSKDGVTYKVGNSSSNVLVVDDKVSTFIYEGISGKKAPIYLVHVVSTKIGVGNPIFLLDCWRLIIRIIENKVNNFESDTEDYKKIEVLMDQAGMHMFMSYFKSLNNPFYRTFYKSSNINTVVDAVKYFNNQNFLPKNKILKFSYSVENKSLSQVEYDSVKDKTTIIHYGITIVLTGKVGDIDSYILKGVSYKMCESLVKSNDKNLRDNVLFYMFSTGGIDDKDIVQLKENNETQESIYDKDISRVNNYIEPTINEVMEKSNFKENEDGDLVSREFEQYIDLNVKENSYKEQEEVKASYIVAKPVEDIKPIEYTSIDSIEKLSIKQKEEVPEYNQSHKRIITEDQNTDNRNSIEQLFKQQSSIDEPNKSSYESSNTDINENTTSSRIDFINKLKQESSMEESSNIKRSIMDNKYTLLDLSKEDCEYALNNKEYGRFNPEDIKSRLDYLQMHESKREKKLKSMSHDINKYDVIERKRIPKSEEDSRFLDFLRNKPIIDYDNYDYRLTNENVNFIRSSRDDMSIKDSDIINSKGLNYLYYDQCVYALKNNVFGRYSKEDIIDRIEYLKTKGSYSTYTLDKGVSADINEYNDRIDKDLKNMDRFLTDLFE